MRHRVGVLVVFVLAAGCAQVPEPAADSEYVWDGVYRETSTGYLVDEDTGRVSVGPDKPFTRSRGARKRLADTAVTNGERLQELSAEIDLFADRVDVLARSVGEEGRTKNRPDQVKEAQKLGRVADTQRRVAENVIWAGIAYASVGESSRDLTELEKAADGSKTVVSRVGKYLEKLASDLRAFEASYPGVPVPKVVLCEHEGFLGRAHGLAADTPRLPAHGRWSASSLHVTHDGWLVFYSKPEFRGSELYVRGPCSLRDLGALARVNKSGETRTWDDRIASVRFAATRPEGEGTYFPPGAKPGVASTSQSQ